MRNNAIFVFLGVILFAASAFCVENQYYTSAWVGDGSSAALNASNHVGFNPPVGLSPGLWYQHQTTSLADPNWEYVQIHGISSSSVVVGRA